MTRCPCGGTIDAIGPVGFCRDCRSMIDLDSLVAYPAIPVREKPAPATRPEIDIPALAEAFMAAQRRLARRFDIHAFTGDALPPAYEDLADNQREHLHESLGAALRAVGLKT